MTEQQQYPDVESDIVPDDIEADYQHDPAADGPDEPGPDAAPDEPGAVPDEPMPDEPKG